MRNFTRFIPGEEINAVASWKFADVDAASMLLRQEAGASDENEQIASVRQQSHAQGYAEGFVQGQAQALLEVQKQINEFMQGKGRETAQQLGDLIVTAKQQLDAAEQLAGQGVLELACEMARQVLRHEISSNPNVLLPVIREALGLLVADTRAIQVRLNPLDLDVLQDILSEEFPALPLTLQADHSVTRGGCVFESGGTVVDGRLEKRWARAIARLGQNMTWEEASDDDAPDPA